jgi:hypothetical protein
MTELFSGTARLFKYIRNKGEREKMVSLSILSHVWSHRIGSRWNAL